MPRRQRITPALNGSPRLSQEVDPLQNADDQEQHVPTFYWGRGFIVGALLSAATVADMLGSGWNAFPV
jgi:hypothetical protein